MFTSQSITPLLIIVRVGLGLSTASNIAKDTTMRSTRPLEFRPPSFLVHVTTPGMEERYPMTEVGTKDTYPPETAMYHDSIRPSLEQAEAV